MKRRQTLHDLQPFLTLWGSQSVSSLGSAMTKYALIIWAYQQLGTASSITMLSVCSFLPSILFCFIAGALTDRWNKKKVMLLSDTAAAMGTLSIFLLYGTESLRIWHLYVMNFLLSFMDAFQRPAAYVAESLIIPKKYYAKASGLQGFSNSLVMILSPALATAILSFWGMEAVFMIDLVSFAVAFFTLLLLINIPTVRVDHEKKKECILKSVIAGLNFLREHATLFRIILFFSLINLLASLAGNAIMPAMILARTGNDKVVLGMVSSAIGAGTLIGSILVTVAKPAKSRTKVIFGTCAASFLLCDFLWGLGRTPFLWVFAAFAGNLPLPFLTANMTTIMRTKVPIRMQGRVFSTRDTVQFITIPVGFFLGGVLADHVFEPFMLTPSRLQQLLSHLVGTGRGSGMALIFLITGTVGAAVSLISLKDKHYRELDVQ